MKHFLQTAFGPAALSAAAVLLTIAPVRAQVPSSQAAALFSGGLATDAEDGAGVSSLSLGWTFTVGPTDVIVSALGFYDDNDTATDFTTGQPIGGTAMSQTHQVGIFDGSGDLLVQATVTPTDAAFDAYSDTPGTAGDGFQLVRYDTGLRDGATGLTPLPDFVLTAGQTYSIAGVTGGDYYTYSADPFSTPSGLVYGDSAYYSDPNGNSETSALLAPSTVDGSFDPGFFGPDFRFTAAPEPSAWASLGLGALGLAGLTWRARKRRSAA